MAKKFTPRPVSKIKCEQDEFYALCMIILINCKNNIAAFAAFKALYTLQYLAELTTEMLAAAAIPFYQARNAIAEVLRGRMVASGDACLEKWQNLKMYIIQAYPENDHKAYLEEAGIEFYAQALRYNWEKMWSLMGAAKQFMANHLTELTANGNMPVGFPAEVDTLYTNTVTFYGQFNEAISTAKATTDNKVNANNAFHKKIMLICKDGRQIFRHDPAKREDFTYSIVLERVRHASTAYQTFEVPMNGSIKIKKLVANTPFVNIGETELVVCNGDVTCTVGTGVTVPAGSTIIIGEDVTTITVLNTNTEHKGYCKVRVIRK